MKIFFWLFLSVLLINPSAYPFNYTSSPRAHATLKDPQGKKVGEAKFVEVKDGVEITIEVKGLTPGKHGIHIHEVGNCEGPDFTSAGAHFNPSAKQHGLANPLGAHGGDLPNLVVNQEGSAKMVMVTKGITLKGEGKDSLFHPGGTSLMIHASADDEKTDPAGNSGARVVCGEISR